MPQIRHLVLFAVLTAVTSYSAPLQAQTIIDEWQSVKAPPAPELKSVTVDPKTTALLLLDFVDPNCPRRPRCVASLPAMNKLLTQARTNGITIIYSLAGQATAADIMKDIAPNAGEVIIKSSVDKFVGTDLDKILKDKGIRSVIVTGTAAHGAVLYTGSAAAMRGIDVIVPVDGMSSEDPFYEQATAWLLAKGTGGIGPRVTLTKVDLIKF